MLTKNRSLRAGCAALALVLLAGCGGSDDAEPKAAKAPSPAASATPTAVAPTAGTRPKDDRSDAGAIAFSEFVVNRIVRVTTGENVDEVLTLASPDCVGCINLAKGRQKNGTVVQQFDGEHKIRDAKVIDTSDDGTQYLVEQRLMSPRGRKVDTATGEVKDTLDTSQFTFRVLMTWKDGRWMLTNYSAKEVS